MHPYSTADDRLKAQGFLATLAVIISIVLNAFVAHHNIGPSYLYGPPTVAAAYALLYRLMDRSAWRWPVVRRLGLVETPIVAGSYDGQLRSNYNGGTSRTVRLEVEQTWSRLIVRFDVTNTQTSSSISIAGALNSLGSQTASLAYTYKNEVRLGVADPDMNDHDGTAQIQINTVSGKATGRYYNYRGRQGTLDLRRVP